MVSTNQPTNEVPTMNRPNLDNLLRTIEIYAGDINLWAEINFTDNLDVSPALAAIIENHIRSVFRDI